MPTPELYDQFPYGEFAYGKDTVHTSPRTVDNFFVIREPDYYVLKWTAPGFNIDGSACTVSKYLVQRTEFTNLVNIQTVATITTTDTSNNIDVLYVDTTIDPTKNYFYQIIPFNQFQVPGLASEFETDWNVPRQSQYNVTSLYSSQKLHYFYSQLQNLQPYDVFDAESNVIPLKNITNNGIPNNDYVYVDFFPSIPHGTILSLYINDELIGTGYTHDYFYITVPYLPKSPAVKVEVRDEFGVTVLKTKYYKTYNYLIFPSTTGTVLNAERVNIETIKNNLYKDTCAVDKIFPNFGVFFNFPKPAWMTDFQYRQTVVGNPPTYPGLISAFLKGGTVGGMKEIIKTFTGLTPTVEYFRDKIAWIVRTDTVPYGLVDIPNPIGNFSSGLYPSISGTHITIQHLLPGESLYINPAIYVSTSSVTYTTTGGPVATTFASNYDSGAFTGQATGTYYFYIDATVPGAPILSYTTSEGVIGVPTDFVICSAYWNNSLSQWFQFKDYRTFDVLNPDFVDMYILEPSVQPPAGQTWYFPRFWGGDASWGQVDDTQPYDDQFWGGTVTTILGFSIPYKAFTIKFTVFNSTIHIADEQIITSSFIDFLGGHDIDLTQPFVVQDEIGNTYIRYNGVFGVGDFTVDVVDGSINWVDPVLSWTHNIPPVGRLYFVTYTFSLRSYITSLVNLLKFPEYRVLFRWL